LVGAPEARLPIVRAEPCSAQLAVAAAEGGGNVKLSCRKGPTKKPCYPGKTPAKIKMFDSSISPSGLLERLVSH